MRIVLSEEDKTPLADVLVAGFDAFNGPVVGPHGWKPLRLMVFRDGEDAPAGGLMGHRYAAWLHVLMFWLPEDLRRDGLGSELLRRAEDWARAEGCVGCYLDTLSWQARPFYEKQGYTLFGELPDSPPGHSRFFMMKRFR
ncbi:MAG: GNAT family N-acetyltransferase [Acetobacteraceae bacterium]|nr:GNAT family N-acetyltransferase [Acetobacteraceae bacterium]